MTKKVAAIDIGLNATRLLISRIQEKPGGWKDKKELLIRIPLRLGEDSFVKGTIGEQRTTTLLRIMKAFNYLMRLHHVETYMAYASAALRENSNCDEVIGLIKEKANIQVQLLTVNEEAVFLYESYSSERLNNSKNYLYVNVGGGTTEIVLLVNGKLADAKRFPIGTIRLLFGLVTDMERKEVTDYLTTIKEKYAPNAIIGAGGNINKVAQLTGVTRDNVLSIRSMQSIYSKLKQQSVESRMSSFELNADRADVIVPACHLFLLIAKTSGVSKIIVPTVGLVDGMIHYLANTRKQAHDMHENSLSDYQLDTFSETAQSSFRGSDETDWFFIDDEDFDDDDDD